ncbi:TPA: hypothetical protein JLN89_000103 [Escherichia coli]|nr:hypothetical protein [Escherichia coli]HBB6967995.1 hypothetical protein [Escherichia coli]HBB9746668.1 hypothetical protein [Escherichia coli]
MKKFLYLKQESFADTWVHGGVVPLYKASTYRKEDRTGIYTPDENQIDNSTHSADAFGGRIRFGDNAQGHIGYIAGHGVAMFNVHLDRRIEDGILLCLSNRRSNFIAKKLEKLACVEIQDIDLLKNIIDEQIGQVGVMGHCKYTSGHKRNHFLKSNLDAWQEEFRIFWKDIENTEIEIPKGLAIRVPIRCRY